MSPCAVPSKSLLQNARKRDRQTLVFAVEIERLARSEDNLIRRNKLITGYGGVEKYYQ